MLEEKRVRAIQKYLRVVSLAGLLLLTGCSDRQDPRTETVEDTVVGDAAAQHQVPDTIMARDTAQGEM